MKSMLIIILIGIILAVVGISLMSAEKNTVSNSSQSALQKQTIKINNTELTVELATKSADHIRGLSGRTSLGENEGMLFIFKIAKTRQFWMKDMHFPIDMIWIRDKEIIGISKNVPTIENSKITRRYSPSPADMVLETTANWTTRHNIKSGDKLFTIFQ